MAVLRGMVTPAGLNLAGSPGAWYPGRVLRYFLRRLLLIIPTFLGVTFLIFGLTRLLPGGPIEKAITQGILKDAEGPATQQRGKTTQLSDEQIEQLKVFYGLDKPILESYVIWLGKTLQLDFGKSTRYGDPVIQMIADRIPISLWFGLTSLVLIYGISIPLGVRKAIRHGSLFDNASSMTIFVGYALPGYVVAIVLLSVFSFGLGWLPIGGFESKNFARLGLAGQLWDRFTHMVLPLIAYTIGSFASLTMTMKNNLMENMAADYIKTAMAKGQSYKKALWHHAFRNSIIPIAAGLGGIITVFFSGTFLIEQIFNIRGMGLLGYQSLMARDYPVIMGIAAITAFLSLLGNVLSDFILALTDPRIRLGD